MVTKGYRKGVYERVTLGIRERNERVMASSHTNLINGLGGARRQSYRMPWPIGDM
jgi:hypothetical protein